MEAEKVEELTDRKYTPDNSTPLYDAMGLSLNRLRKKVAEEDKVLVTIITDGYENASREYDIKAIKALVETLKQSGWVFTYIGANQNVEEVAATISVTNTMCFQANVEGTRQMFAKESQARSRWFDCVASKCRDLSENFFKEE